MIKLRFEPSGFEIAVPKGTAIVDVTDENPSADVPYSCRAANCGTCRVRVSDGMSLLSPPEDDELSVHELYRDAADVRLACQLRIVGDDGRVVLHVIRD